MNTTCLLLVITRMGVNYTVLTNSVWIFKIVFYSYH